MRRVLAALGIAALAIVLSASPALAHANIVRSTPVNGSSVPAAPDHIDLELSEPVILDNAEMSIQNTAGQDYEPLGKSHGASPAILRFDLPELDDGVYSFRWKVVSATDSHVTEGLVILGIGSNADLGTASFEQPSNPVQSWEVALRWLLYGAVALAIGAWALTSVGTSGDESDDAGAWISDALVRLSGISAAVTAGVLAILLAGQGLTIAAATGGSALGAIGDLVDSGWGSWWTVRFVGALSFAAIIFVQPRRSRFTALIAPIVLGIIALAQAASGHMAGAEHRLLAVLSATIHLVGIGLWIGGVVALAVIMMQARRSAGARIVPDTTFRSFAPIAVTGIVLTTITGFYSMGVNVASADALLFSTYGRVLVAKIVIVAIVAILGGVNFRRFRSPRTRSGDRARGFVVAEAALAGTALLAASYLTASPSANDGSWDPAVVASEDLRGAQVGDLQVGIEIAPGRAGENLVRVQAASIRRPAPAPIGRVILEGRSTDGDQDLRLDLDSAQPGFYEAGVTLPVAGEWDFDVIVRRPGFPDQTASFDWGIPTAGTRELRVSDQPLSDWTNRFAAGGFTLGVLTLVALVVRALRRRRRDHELDTFLLGASANADEWSTR